jgi:hypothetical protein
MKNEMEGACGTYGGQQRCIQGFDGKRQLERPRRRWEVILKLSLKKWEGKA